MEPQTPQPSTPSPAPTPQVAPTPGMPVPPEQCGPDKRYAETMEGLDSDERLVCEIHKHPLGLIIMYLGSFVGLIAAVAIIFFLIPQLVSEASRSKIELYLAVLMIMVAMIIGIGLLVATYVYQRTMLIISNKNVTQIIQRSLFSRKVSELSMSNVEDVTADKNGLIQTIFNYGQLRVETAGSLENFIFDYCPRPNYYGRIILEARQQYADSLKEKD